VALTPGIAILFFRVSRQQIVPLRNKPFYYLSPFVLQECNSASALAVHDRPFPKVERIDATRTLTHRNLFDLNLGHMLGGLHQSFEPPSPIPPAI